VRKGGISTVPYIAGINQVHSALTNNRRGVDASVRAPNCPRNIIDDDVIIAILD